MPSDHRKYRPARVIVLVLLTIVYYVVPWSRAGAAAELVGLPLLLLQVLVLPGYIFLNALQPRARDPFETITGSLLVGLAYFLALAFAAVPGQRSAPDR